MNLGSTCLDLAFRTHIYASPTFREYENSENAEPRSRSSLGNVLHPRSHGANGISPDGLRRRHHTTCTISDSRCRHHNYLFLGFQLDGCDP